MPPAYCDLKLLDSNIKRSLIIMRGWGRTCEGVTRHLGDHKTKYFPKKYKSNSASAFHHIFCWARLHLNWRNAWLQFLIFTSPSLLQRLGSSICSFLTPSGLGNVRNSVCQLCLGEMHVGGLTCSTCHTCHMSQAERVIFTWLRMWDKLMIVAKEQ